MKRMCILNVESVIGLLTNSSSEIFVSKQGMTVSAVRDILEKIVEGYNLMSGNTNCYNDFFSDDIEILDTDEKVKDFINEYASYVFGYDREINRIFGSEMFNGKFIKWENVFKEKQRLTADGKSDNEISKLHDWEASEIERKRLLDKWIKDNPERLEQFKGIVVVHSCGDNSVPYGIWKMINDLLGGTNYHIG